MASDVRQSLPEIVHAFGLNLERDVVQVVPLARVLSTAAAAPFNGGLLPISPLLPVIVHLGEAGTADRDALTILAGALQRHYGPDTHVQVLVDGGVDVVRLDRLADVESLAALYAQAVDPLVNGSDPRAMQQVSARLRRPDGCPWDRKQTYSSLSQNLVDEVYEAVDAIESGDVEHLAEELGDLFLMIMLFSQIAHENGDFSVEDVYAGITRKIVGRHPHVFGDDIVKTDADLSVVWAREKAREASESGKRGGKDVDGEPFSMPALARAARVLKKRPLGDGEAPDLLRIVGELIEQGKDPDAVLREQLRAHVLQGGAAASAQGSHQATG